MDNEKRISADLIITNAKQLVTCRGHRTDDPGLLEVEKGCLAVQGERIVFIGSAKELEKERGLDTSHAQFLDASECVVVPGFVDCHTHAVFGESRVREYALRLGGYRDQNFTELSLKTGMAASVEMTRGASEKELYDSAKFRIMSMLNLGTTTVEIKSGYGLSTYHEGRMLEVTKRLGQNLPIDIHATFLGAHGWPEHARKDYYMGELIGEMLPQIASAGLATACDIWCDEGYYTAEESRRILRAARDLGMKIKMHTDAYSYIGGSNLAAEMSMLSADHLNFTPRQVLRELAQSNVVGVLLPTTDFNVNHPRPFKPRPMLEEGMVIALATNCNPGNWGESMPFVMAMACRNHGLTPAEALRAATIGGATALGMECDRGSLEVGKRADLQVLKISTYEELPFRLGGPLTKWVVKNGKVVVGSPI